MQRRDPPEGDGRAFVPTIELSTASNVAAQTAATNSTNLNATEIVHRWEGSETPWSGSYPTSTDVHNLFTYQDGIDVTTPVPTMIDIAINEAVKVWQGPVLRICQNTKPVRRKLGLS